MSVRFRQEVQAVPRPARLSLSTEKKIIHVVAGVLRNRDGKILLTERPPGKHLAGLWEFPGGKCENGETPQQALRRELHEEIGVDAGAMRRLIGFPWHYAEKSIYLDVYDVTDFSGEPHGKEGQGLRWEVADDLPHISMPAADVSIVTALRLPDCYAITPEPHHDSRAFLASLGRVLDSGVRLIQLRAKNISTASLRQLASEAHLLTSRSEAKLLLNGNAALVEELGLDGLHMPAADAISARSRPLDSRFLICTSCHDAEELRLSADMGADFCVLGPVKPTTSHENRAPMGWQRFAEIVAASPLPVYALGGLARPDLPDALRARAQGIAGISGFWIT
jgi:8-oxo-dGTP diphosphatase